jgi:fatty acid-binding protein DegV
MSVCEVFEIIRSGGYFILYFFSSKTHSSSYGKKINAHPILKSSPSVTVDSEFIFFGDKFVKHFSLQFQQLN